MNAASTFRRIYLHSGLLILLGCSPPAKPTKSSPAVSGAVALAATAPAVLPGNVPMASPPSFATSQQLEGSLSVAQLAADETLAEAARVNIRGVIGDLALCPDCFEVDGEEVCGEPCIEYAVLQSSSSETTPHVVLTTSGRLSGWFEAGKSYVIEGTVTRRGAPGQPTTAEVELTQRWLLP